MDDHKQSASQFLTPGSFIEAAKAAHPAFRYALAIAGILAIVATFAKFGVSYATLTLGVIAVLGLMALFLVFAQASKLTRSHLDTPATVFVWSFLVMGIFVSFGLISSVFFNAPLPFRDYIVIELSLGSPQTNVKSDATKNDSVSPAKAIVVAELTDSYLATGRLFAFLSEWGQSSTRPTLHVKDGVLTGTSLDGRTVSTSVDPKQIPIPRHVSEISKLNSDDAESATRFFASYEQFRAALVRLNSNPSDFSAALTNATESARLATVRGHEALCVMGIAPPRMFPAGGFLEPMPATCSPGPFADQQTQTNATPPYRAPPTDDREVMSPTIEQVRRDVSAYYRAEGTVLAANDISPEGPHDCGRDPKSKECSVRVEITSQDVSGLRHCKAQFAVYRSTHNAWALDDLTDAGKCNY